ncbi:MAG TPA: RodZ domain-containing protein [Candidatus Limnocylindria bacterium]|jgi:cytoskeletal protein RodZ
MTSLGEQLRAQREKKGITLEQAAADTRIREKFLHALEEGDHRSLPGAVYTRGFLRNYSDYLDLDTDELIETFQKERVGPPEPAPKRSFKPYKPVVRRGLIFRPVVFVPVLILAFVGAFLGYMYYQFTTFATLPKLEITDPATDGLAGNQELVVRGVTVPDGRITVNVFPGPDVFGDIRPALDGTFSTTVALKPGSNHVVVEVLDTAGKTNRVSRTIQYQAAATGVSAPPVLAVDQPANGATFTNTYVQVSGHVDRGVTVQINTVPVAVSTDGTFQARYYLPAGPQSFRIVARNSAGGTVEETRAVAVAYTAAVVIVRVTGGDSWILATVDGKCDPCQGRTFKDGETATYQGREVRIRTGNAAAVQVNYNGQVTASLGRPGEIVERVFVAQ